MFYRKLILVAGLALLAFPGAALADGVNFGFSGGLAYADTVLSNSPTYGGTPSNLVAVVKFPNSPIAFYGLLGTVVFTTGQWSDNLFQGLGGFLPGGSIVITSNADFANQSGIADGTTLFSGTFNSNTSWVMMGGSPSAGWTFNLSGSVTGLLSPELITRLGLPSYLVDRGGLTSLDVTFQFGSGTSSLDNGSLTIHTPEPGTLALFGTGLLGIAAVLRRKLAA